MSIYTDPYRYPRFGGDDRDPHPYSWSRREYGNGFHVVRETPSMLAQLTLIGVLAIAFAATILAALTQ